MLKLTCVLSSLSLALPVLAGELGWLTVRGPLEGRALTHPYGDTPELNIAMDLNGQMAWETPFNEANGGDAVRYDMMLSTGSGGNFDSFTYVQVSRVPPSVTPRETPVSRICASLADSS